MKSLFKIFVWVVFCLFAKPNISALCGQEHDSVSVIARAYYELSHLINKDNPENIYHEDFLLLLGQGASLFTSITNQNQKIALYQEDEFSDDVAPGEFMPIANPVVSRYSTPTQIYLFKDKSEIFVREVVFNSYLYEDKFEQPVWKIVNMVDTINGYVCEKAVSSFKGRNWEVWFTTELPFSYGPWYLFGLPGLILSAYDTNNEVSFSLKGFEIARKDLKYFRQSEYDPIDYNKVSAIILPPKYYAANKKIHTIRAKKADVLKLKHSRNENWKAFDKAQMAASKGIINDLESFLAIKHKPKISNPIDLEN